MTTDMDFTVADVEMIHRIVLSNKQGTADLRREADHWKINGKYRVMQSKIEVLLETIQKLSVRAPVPKIRLQAVMKEFEAGSTKVEIYSGDEDKPSRVYYVDGNTEDSKGTYMLMELDGKKAEKPYIIGLPGFVGILSVRYFTDETQWRDTQIFDYSADDIRQITVEYPEQPENSFRISVISPDSFALYPAEGAGDAIQPRRIYKEGVMKYLSSFKFLHAEAFDNANPKKDSILGSAPFVSVTVTGRNDLSEKMIVFRMPLNRRSKMQYDEQGNKLPYDLDRYYASIHDGRDFVIIQDYVFGKIFRRYSDFFLK